MRVLLDTHVALWLMMSSPRLSKRGRTAIARADEVCVSAASLWELTIKVGLGKIEIDVDAFARQLDSAGCVELPVTWRHSRFVRLLQGHHRDPFDRLMLAQALAEDAIFLTSDETLGQYGEFVSVV